MSDDVPSPADRRPVQAAHAERDGLSPLPWEGALYSAVRALEAQLHACRQENAELRLSISQLEARLTKARAWARTSSDNWRRRQAAWRAERAELLARLGGDQ